MLACSGYVYTSIDIKTGNMTPSNSELKAADALASSNSSRSEAPCGLISLVPPLRRYILLSMEDTIGQKELSTPLDLLRTYSLLHHFRSLLLSSASIGTKNLGRLHPSVILFCLAICVVHCFTALDT